MNTRFKTACTSGDLETIAILTQELDSDNKQTILSGALSTTITTNPPPKNQIQIIDYLIKAGASLNVNDNKGYTIFHIAAQNNAQAIVEFLLDMKLVNIDAKTAAGQTALGLAISNNHTKLAQLLIKNNADLEIGRGTAFKLAILKNNKEVAQSLIQKNAKLDQEVKMEIKDYWYRFTGKYLHLAALMGATDIVKMLIARGVDINIQAKYKFDDSRKGAPKTALDLAVIGEKIPIINVLLDNKAAINDDSLNFFINSKNRQMIEILLKKSFNYPTNVSNKIFHAIFKTNFSDLLGPILCTEITNKLQILKQNSLDITIDEKHLNQFFYTLGLSNSQTLSLTNMEKALAVIAHCDQLLDLHKNKKPETSYSVFGHKYKTNSSSEEKKVAGLVFLNGLLTGEKMKLITDKYQNILSEKEFKPLVSKFK